MELLCCAAEDPAVSVVQQALETIQLVVDRHWGRWGEGYDVMSECISATAKAARNPYHTESSLQAINLLKTCGEELAKPAITDDASPGESWSTLALYFVTGEALLAFSSC